MKTPAAFKHMYGKIYMFRSESHKIKNIVHSHDDFWKVVTDVKEFKVSESQLKEDFRHVVSEEEKQTVVVIHSAAERELSQMQSVSDILMDNIKKVQEDPKYIEQAKSVNDSVKNLIDAKRTQIDVIRLMQGV